MSAAGSVIHVVENLNMGGAERVVIDLVQAQQARGMDCTVVCLFEAGVLAPELAASNTEVIALGKRPGLDREVLRALRALVRARRPAVIHTHNAVPHYYAVLATLGLPVRRINTRHGMGDFLGNAKQRWLYRLAMLATHRACCVCDAARQQFVSAGLMPEDKAVTVYNGLPLSRFADSGRGALRQLLGLAPGQRLLVSVGRLNPAKAQELLIDAFARLAPSHPDLHLVLVGDGPQRAALEARAAEQLCATRIHFTGARSDVPALLRDADVFALSSRTEGFSIALLEAGCAALPVVATAVGGNGEIIADGERGLLVPAGDSMALASAIEQLLTSPQGQACGQALAQWVADHCSVEAMADRYQQIYAPAGAAS